MSDRAINVTLREVAPPIQAEIPADGSSVWNLSLEDIESVSGKVLKRTTCGLSELGSTKCSFDGRHVLYSKLRPYLNKVVLPDGPGVGTSELIPLLPDPKRLDREYLAFYLRSPDFVRFATSVMQGANLPRVAMKELWSHRLTLRDPEHQRRVVGRIKECLGRVEEMQRLREHAAIDAEVLVSAALREVWESETIADAPQVSLAELGSITTGNTPSRKVPDYFASTGTPWITPGDMNGAKEISSAREFLSPRGVAEARARVLPANSVAVCCIGATIGKVALVRNETGINQQINAITFGKRVNPDFGFWACRALYPQILSNAAQATLPILNKSRFGELTIPVPELKVQERTAAKLDKVLEGSLAMKATSQELAKEENILRESILREAFGGNL